MAQGYGKSRAGPLYSPPSGNEREDLYKLTKAELIERLLALDAAQQNLASAPSDTRYPDPHMAIECWQIEETPRQEHSFISAVLNTVGALVVVLDRHGRVVRFNRECERISGYSFEELQGRLAWDVLLLPEERETVESVFEQLSGGLFPNAYENHWVGKDGQRHLIAWSNTALLSPDDSVEYVIGTGIDITERRQVEKAQFELLTKFEATFENAAIGVAHVAPDGRWLRVNEKLCEITRYSCEELLTKTFLDITYPEDLEQDREKLTLLLGGEISSCSFEKRYIQKNGEILWSNVTVSLIRNAAGEPDYFVSFIADITDRKRVEIALRESESRLEAVINQAPALVFLKDREGRRQLVNEEYLRAFGYTREEVIGKTDFEIFPPEVAKRLRSNDETVWKTGIPVTVEELVPQPDGAHTYLAKKFLLTDSEGRPYSLCGVSTDITERKQRADALKESEEHLRRVLDSLFAFVEVLTPDGTLVQANRAPLEAAGIQLDEIRGKKFWDCYWWSYSPLVQAQLQAAIERAAQGESSRYDVEVRVAGGAMVSIDFMLAPMRDSEGRITHLIPSAVDITDRKQLEREVLEVSAREQRRIGQDLHDDLCQRLSAIELLSHTLTLDLEPKSTTDSAKAAKVASYVREAIVHTRLLARGLSPVNVTADGLITALRELAANSERLFQIRCDFECVIPVLVTNPDAAMHLYRIAQESISNAVRHGKATELSIALKPHANCIGLYIVDNGCGIAQPLPISEGMGLRIMRHRAGMIGALLEVRPGERGGTEVACIFPQEL